MSTPLRSSFGAYAFPAPVSFQSRRIQYVDADDDDASAAVDDALEKRVAAALNSTATSLDTPSTLPTEVDDKEESTAEEGLPLTKAQAGNTPPRSDSSSNASTPDEIPPSPLLASRNPYSGYTAGVASPLGMAIFTSNHSDERLSDRKLYRRGTLLDSDEELERYARRIRTEIRHTEMVQLALLAERAAEAGEERFAGKPSTYSTDDVEIGSGLKRPARKRNKSFSEGTRIPIQPSRTATGVMALRDADEVLPDFSGFHVHLRSHFARCEVDKTTLMFHEARRKRKSTKTTPERRRPALPRRSKRPEKNFLDSLRINGWGRNSESNVQDDSCVSATDFGVEKLLRGRWPPDCTEPRSLSADASPIVTQAVLETRSDAGPSLALGLPSDLKSTERLVLKPRKRPSSSQTVETEATTLSSGPEPSTPVKLQSDPPSPSALIDDDNAGSENSSIGHMFREKPFVETPNKSQTTPMTAPTSVDLPPPPNPDFVTPARLRNIRGGRKLFDYPEYPSSNSLLMPTNSVVESPPFPRLAIDQPLLEANESLFVNESKDSSILIPPYFMKEPSGADTPQQSPRSLSLALSTDMDTPVSAPVPLQTKTHPLPWSPLSLPTLRHLGERASAYRAETQVVDVDFPDVSFNSILKEPSVATDRDAPWSPLSLAATEHGSVTTSAKAAQIEEPASLPINSAASLGPSRVQSGQETMEPPSPPPTERQETKEPSSPPPTERQRRVRVTVSGNSRSANEQVEEPPALPIISAESLALNRAQSGQQEKWHPVSKPVAEPQRRVRVSVFGHSASNEQVAAGARELQQSQLIAIEKETRPDASVQTPQGNCDCLALSRNSSLDSNEVLDDVEEDRMRVIRRSMSVDAVPHRSKTELNQWNLFSDGEVKVAESEFGSETSFQAAMTMIQRLSPSNEMFGARTRSIYLNPKENDEFLNNYLYRSRQADDDDEVGVYPGNDAFCSQPCQESSETCDVDPTVCCSSMLFETAVNLIPRSRTPAKRPSKGHLNLDSSKMEQETWFDAASERFDGMLEKLSGVSRKQGSAWNIAFKAPSLKKTASPATEPKPVVQIRPSVKPLMPLLDVIDEKKANDDESSWTKQRRSHVRHMSIPQPLYQEPRDALSDKQFRLIYGITREQLLASREEDSGVASGLPLPRVSALDDAEVPVSHTM